MANRRGVTRRTLRWQRQADCHELQLSWQKEELDAKMFALCKQSIFMEINEKYKCFWQHCYERQLKSVLEDWGNYCHTMRCIVDQLQCIDSFWIGKVSHIDAEIEENFNAIWTSDF